jgi:hypothetical protein
MLIPTDRPTAWTCVAGLSGCLLEQVAFGTDAPLFLVQGRSSCHRGQRESVNMVVFPLAALVVAAAGAATSGEELPTVSILIPTNGRPEFVRNAVEMIARQDFPMALIKEVVIVDDSPPDLQVPDIRIGTAFPVLYTTLSKPHSIGEKRNLAASRATGDVLVHWDDDDIYGRGRLRAQLAPIVRGDADITLLQHRWTYFMDKDELHESDGTGRAASALPASWGPHFGTLVSDRRSK